MTLATFNKLMEDLGVTIYKPKKYDEDFKVKFEWQEGSCYLPHDNKHGLILFSWYKYNDHKYNIRLNFADGFKNISVMVDKEESIYEFLLGELKSLSFPIEVSA